jgi:phosphohistidine swiveling domain-containing protein
MEEALLTGDDALLEDPGTVGHKFARQAALRRAGFPVPEFVCLPATLYDSVVVPVLGEPEPVTSAAESAAFAAARAERIRRLSPPVDVIRGLLARFDDLAGPGGLVAVRACVVGGDDLSGEDSDTDPFAGLSSSFLYVRREDLARRVVDCWASGFNQEAVAYRIARGLSPWRVRVAVGVQRMIVGTRSFVAFTRDPRDGARHCVIAAAFGNGEGVVQEKADVDHVLVERATGRVEQRLAHKVRAAGAGGTPDAVPADLADTAVLSDADAREITRLGERIEEYFGGPQDIEGTITADGTVHIVQSRPISGLPTPRKEAQEEAIPWANTNVTESFPGVSCALTFSMAAHLYEAGFTDFYRRLGVGRRTLSRNRHRLASMVGHLDGRIYYRLDSWYHMHSKVRGLRPIWTTWERSIGLRKTVGDTAAERPRTSRFRTALYVAEMIARATAHPRRVAGFLRWWDGYHRNLDDVDARATQEVLEAYRDLWREVADRWGTTLVNNFFLMSATWVNDALLRRWAPAADRGLITGMLCGGPENRSAAAMRSLIDLAGIAARNGVLVDDDEKDDALRARWERARTAAEHAEFARAAADHLRRYGDRGLHDLKIEAVTPRIAPWTLLRLLKPYADLGLTTAANRAAEQATRREAQVELRRHTGRVRGLVLRLSFRTLRWLVKAREDTRFCRTELIGDTRALLLRLGADLAAAKRIDDPRDVLDLTVDEVTGAFDGTLPGADLRSLAAARAIDRRESQERVALPPRLWTDPGLPLAAAVEQVRQNMVAEAPTQAPAEVLHGLGSCSGTVRARAKVVLDPDIDAAACAGHILVARETDPGWLFLMLVAKGLVVERGTLLSHTAITGRLLGIPTAVAVDAATTAISDGDLVELDGTSGTVTVLARGDVP